MPNTKSPPGLHIGEMREYGNLLIKLSKMILEEEKKFDVTPNFHPAEARVRG
jgi:hypothetical protein